MEARQRPGLPSISGGSAGFSRKSVILPPAPTAITPKALASAFETSIPLPPFGVLEIGPTPLVAALTGVMYPGPDGVHVIQAQVQPNPTLVGKAVHIQSVAILSFVPFDVRLTNKATVSFL